MRDQRNGHEPAAIVGVLRDLDAMHALVRGADDPHDLAQAPTWERGAVALVKVNTQRDVLVGAGAHGWVELHP